MNTKPLIAVLVVARSLVAQQPGPPRGHMMGDPMAMQEMMGPVMQVMLNAPHHLLARKDELRLNADQVGRLTALRNATEAGMEAAMSEMQAHMRKLQQAASAPAPDTSALKTEFQAAHAAMGKAHWLALVSAVQAKAVLNDAQRAKLKVWADSMQTWMQQHRQMMKPSQSH